MILLALSFVFLKTSLLSQVQKEADGILLTLIKQKPSDPQTIRVQVCADNIVRIVASPERSFSQRPSLMVTNNTWPAVQWTLQEHGGWAELTTSKLRVRVLRSTGAVEFYDSAGKALLRENKEGGKSIVPADVLGERTNHVRQVFDSPVDEALYGLGEHQNDVMNYKGHDVDLFQYNIVDVVPFLVSNRNYGILWDNNSHTKFGDPRDYQSLEGLTLYSKDGVKGGLTAEYCADTAFAKLVVSRPEPRIQHEFIDVNDKYPDGFERDIQAVRWSGEVSSAKAGMHKFRLYASSYVKMWLDGKLVVDAWRQNWLPWTYLLTLPMDAGKRYPIKIEWIHGGGYIGLTHLGPDRESTANSISLWSEVADQLDYYFIGGDNLDQVIQGYRELTGKAPMMPEWALGLWQCRERYKTQEELLSVVREFRKRHIPLDNIVQDWFYWKEDQWGSHEFDASRYPDPAGMIRDLHDSLHTQIMISVWPKFYVGTKHYDEFKNQGWLYMRNVEKAQRDWVGPGYVSTFYDPYSPGARQLFWKQIDEKLFSQGIDAWWLDCTEPDICSNLSRTETILRQGPTALGSGARYSNSYSIMNCQAVYEGQRRTKPDQRVFILTRSAFPGQQRYAAATWSGDVAARWYDLRAQIAAGLNFSLSGIPYWTTDIGGFAVEPRYEHPNDADLDEWRELMTRWFQFGAFCPIFRVHGQYPYREMFNVAPDSLPAYQSMLKFDRLRYRLMPYIYSLAGMVTHQDYTMMRALVMDFGGDAKVLDIGDQFMFGPAFLVNPVTEYKVRTRPVYLPSGTGWYDFRTGHYYDGGRTILADAPSAEIPVYIRAGSIIPCGPEIEYTSQKAADTIRVFVFAGHDGEFTLYEDEGVNYNYEKGAFATIPMRYADKDRTLTIGQREGGFPGMLQKRVFEIVWIDRQNPIGLNFEVKPFAKVMYDGTVQTVQMK